MKQIILAAFLFLTALIQANFLSRFRIWEITPNLVFLSVFIFFFWNNLYQASNEQESLRNELFAALTGGFFLDMFSGQPFGSAIISFVSVIVASFFFFEYIFDKKDFKAIVPAIFLGTFFYNLIILLTLRIYGLVYFLEIGFNFWKIVFGEAVLNAFLGIIILISLQKLIELWFPVISRKNLKDIN